MPIIHSAIKKLRQDEKHYEQNKLVKLMLRKTIREFKKAPSSEKMSKVYKKLDMAAKKLIIHQNKAARLKSHLSRHLNHPKSGLTS